MINAVIGIDPGATGAMVLMTPDVHNWISRPREVGIDIVKFKGIQLGELVDYIRGWTEMYTICVYMELVGAMPKDGKHNAFAFGNNVGRLQGILCANHLPLIEVAPQVWQRHFKLGAKFPSKKERKHAHLAKAQELFPEIKITLDTCDAILIGMYAYHMEFK